MTPNEKAEIIAIGMVIVGSGLILFAFILAIEGMLKKKATEKKLDEHIRARKLHRTYGRRDEVMRVLLTRNFLDCYEIARRAGISHSCASKTLATAVRDG